MADSFYVNFENRFRGSREEIRKKESVYLPLLAPLQGYYPDAPLLDLGCGRGEWLELAGEAGWQAVGVELDPGMADHAAARGLRVERDEALGFLRKQEAESFCAVTGFHIAEHLEFDLLLALVGEIHRVLRPGGIIILETPNPENLTVGGCSFYTDPTHRAPFPPGLLSFLVENGGFARVGVMRLNELPVGETPADFSMVKVLYGVSPDYAVVAQKAATSFALADFPWLRESHGQSLFEAASAFDQGVQARLAGLAGRQEETAARLQAGLADVEKRQEANASAQEAKAAAQEANALVQEAKVALLQAALADLGRRHDEHTAQLHAALAALAKRQEETIHILHHAYAGLSTRIGEVSALQAQLHSVYSSTSWQVTRPLRAVSLLLRAGFAGQAGGESLRRRIVDGVLARPALAGRLRALLNRFPRLKARLRPWYWAPVAGMETPVCSSAPIPAAGPRGVRLTPGAARVYRDLQAAIAEGQAEKDR